MIPSVLYPFSPSPTGVDRQRYTLTIFIDGETVTELGGSYCGSCYFDVSKSAPFCHKYRHILYSYMQYCITFIVSWWQDTTGWIRFSSCWHSRYAYLYRQKVSACMVLRLLAFLEATYSKDLVRQSSILINQSLLICHVNVVVTFYYNRDNILDLYVTGFACKQTLIPAW